MIKFTYKKRILLMDYQPPRIARNIKMLISIMWTDITAKYISLDQIKQFVVFELTVEPTAMLPRI